MRFLIGYRNTYEAAALINPGAKPVRIKVWKSGILSGEPNSEEDVDGNLYYMEHQPATGNKMEVIGAEGERLKIRLTGITEVNYYDGSKPKNTMELVTWFDKN